MVAMTSSEWDQPFPKSGAHLFGRSPGAGMVGNDPHAFPDRPHCARRSLGVLRREEAVATLYALKGLRCSDQLWHSGGSTSWPASNWAS